MGLTLMFRLDESCIAKHLNERKPKEPLQEKGLIDNTGEI